MADEWLTVAEASRLFLASETTIRKRVKSGELNGRQLPHNGRDILHVAKSELAKLFCLRVEDAETIDEVMAGQSKMAALLKLSENNLVATLVGAAAAMVLPTIWQAFREWSIGVLEIDDDTSDASLIEQFDEVYDSGETVKMQLERSVKGPLAPDFDENAASNYGTYVEDEYVEEPFMKEEGVEYPFDELNRRLDRLERFQWDSILTSISVYDCDFDVGSEAWCLADMYEFWHREKLALESTMVDKDWGEMVDDFCRRNPVDAVSLFLELPTKGYEGQSFRTVEIFIAPSTQDWIYSVSSMTNVDRNSVASWLLSQSLRDFARGWCYLRPVDSSNP